MASCKTGEDHLASLRDERAVYIDGERVADVTTHPAFRWISVGGGVRSGRR